MGFLREHFTVSVAVVTAAAFVIRLVYLALMGPHIDLGLDAAWYSTEAQALAAGRGYIDPRVHLLGGADVATANFPPLWPLVLALAERLGMDTTFRHQVVGALVGSGVVAVVAFLGRRVAGAATGLLAAVLVACSPMLIAADGSLMAEPLFVLLVTGAVLAVYRALDEPTVGRFAAVGALAGLAAITRSDGLVLIALLVVVSWWRLDTVDLARRIGLVGVTIVIGIVPVAAFDVYSSVRMGGTVLTTSNAGNMLTGANCGSTYYTDLIGAWDARCASDLEPGEDERAWAAEAREAGLDYAREHAKRLPLVATARVLRTFGLWRPTQTARLEAVETRNETWQLVGWGTNLVLLGAAAVGMVVLRRRRVGIAPMLAVVAGVVVTAALSNGNTRFRLVADPVVAIAAAVTLLAALGRWRRRRPRRPGAPTAPTPR